jgi:two-component system sensor histidine kinase YesM
MSISTLASEIGNWEIVKVCSQLSEMLRYTAAFEKGITTLEKEIEHSVNYLKLIKLRYEDHLEFIIELDERINEIKLPKLILQPIIENCISHGFKNSYPPYKINIKGVIENNHWKVTVSDNGCGFDETSRDRIFEQVGQYRNEAYSGKVFDRLEIGGMGLMNIYLRLSLFYGSETIFEIYNMPDGGATVVIGGAF